MTEIGGRRKLAVSRWSTLRTYHCLGLGLGPRSTSPFCQLTCDSRTIVGCPANNMGKLEATEAEEERQRKEEERIAEEKAALEAEKKARKDS